MKIGSADSFPGPLNGRMVIEDYLRLELERARMDAALSRGLSEKLSAQLSSHRETAAIRMAEVDALIATIAKQRAEIASLSKLVEQKRSAKVRKKR